MPPFNDVRVRRAMYMATDLKSIARSLYGPDGQVNTWPFPYHPLYADVVLDIDAPETPQSVKELYIYNPEKAKQLLKEAGYPNGFKTSALITSGEADYFSILKDMWAKVGVELVLDVKESGTKNAIVGKKEHTGITTSGQDPLAAWFSAGSLTAGTGVSNAGNINDPTVNEVMEKVRRVILTNEKEAMKMFKQMMPYFLDQAYALPRGAAPQYLFWWPWIKNYSGEAQVGYGTGSMDNWVIWVWLDQEMKKSMGFK